MNSHANVLFAEAKTAVIGSQTGAFDMLAKDDETGALIGTDDVTGLVRAAEKLLSDPHRTLQMGQAARDIVARSFTVEAEAPGIGRVYASLFDA